MSRQNASYNLSAPFNYAFPGYDAEIQGLPVVSPSGAHVAYFYDRQLVIRSTSTAELDQKSHPNGTGISFDYILPISLLKIKKIIDMGPVISQSFGDSSIFENRKGFESRNKNQYKPNIIVEWDSSFFHNNSSTRDEESEKANSGPPVTIEDRLAVVVGLEIFIFVFSSNDKPFNRTNATQNNDFLSDGENESTYIQDWESAVDSVISIPSSLLLKSTLSSLPDFSLYKSSLADQAKHSRASHGYRINKSYPSGNGYRKPDLKKSWNNPAINQNESRKFGYNRLDPVHTAAEAGLSICGIQWLQGYTEDEEQVVRLCIYLGEPSVSSTDSRLTPKIESGEIGVCIGSDINSSTSTGSCGKKYLKGNRQVGNAVAILVCSVEAIELVIKSPKPGFKVIPISFSYDHFTTRYSHYYNESNQIATKKSLFGILTRDSTVDTFVLFDLIPRIHKVIPFCPQENSIPQALSIRENEINYVLDAKHIELSPGGDYIAVLDSHSVGYSVSVFSMLTGLPLSAYKGPYCMLPPCLNVEPAVGILWTRVYWGTISTDNQIGYKDLLLIPDRLGIVTIMEPTTGKPIANIDHGTGLVLSEQIKNHVKETSIHTKQFDEFDLEEQRQFDGTMVYYEDTSTSTGMAEYILGEEPFDPPLVPTKVFSPSSRDSPQEIIDVRVIHMAACCGYVATVVASLPSAVFLWKLGGFNYNIHTKSQLICVFYHKSFIKSLSFRDSVPANCTSYGSFNPRVQLMIVTQKGHMIGLWDSLAHDVQTNQLKISKRNSSNSKEGYNGNEINNGFYENNLQVTTQPVPSAELIQFLDLLALEQSDQAELDLKTFNKKQKFTIEKRNDFPVTPITTQNNSLFIADNDNQPNQNNSNSALFKKNQELTKKSVFNAAFVNNQLDSNSFGVFVWNRTSFALFYKILRFDELNSNEGKSHNDFKFQNIEYFEAYAHHFNVNDISQLRSSPSSFIDRQRQGSPQIIQDIDDSFGRRVEAEVQQREWYGNVSSFDINDENNDTFFHLLKRG